jgi:glycosyltransferase involved in cell wall biosynthesis
VNKSVEVLVCWHWDPFDDYPGGIGRFIEDMIANSPPTFRYTILTATKKNVKLGGSIHSQFGGRLCNFIPLIANTKIKKSIIPLRMKYVFAIRTYLKRATLPYDVIHYHGIEPGLAFLHQTQIKKMLFIHGDPNSRWSHRSESYWRFIPKVFYEYFENTVIENTNNVFVINPDCYSQYQKRFANRIESISKLLTWVDPTIFYPISNELERLNEKSLIRDKLGISKDSIFIIYFGRFEEIKDPILLIKSIEKLVAYKPNAILHMIGGGKLEKEMRSLINELKLDCSISILTYKPREEIRSLLLAADLSVLPSRSEGMSMAVNESLAVGCPVVAFDVGENASVIKDGVSGQIVRDRTPECFSLGITKVISNINEGKITPLKVSEKVKHLIPTEVLKEVFSVMEI